VRGTDCTYRTGVRVPFAPLAPLAAQGLVIALAGVVLFFAPTLGHDLWGWELTPFNTRFLGGIYLAALVPFATLLVVRTWELAQLVVPMDFVFMSIVLCVSLAYADRFLSDRPVTWAWFTIFVSIPLYTGYFLLRYRERLRPVVHRPAPRVRTALLAAAVPLGGYGLAMLAAPGTVTGFWPWPIDGFHGRVYSAIFVSLALGAAILARGGGPVGLRTLGLTCVALGALEPIGLVVVDARVDKVDWSAAGTWAWLAMFAALFAYGLVLSALALQRNHPAVSAAPA
jgi:hypothetical protein